MKARYGSDLRFTHSSFPLRLVSVHGLILGEKKRFKMDLDNLIKAWDVRWVRRECWSSCEKGFESKYMRRVDEDAFPVYRDPQTLSDFLGSARHFECSDVCETDYLHKRLIVALPAVLAGVVLVLGCLCCYFWKGCLVYKMRQKRKRLAESASSLTLSTATTVSVIEKLKNEVGDGSKSWVVDDRDGGRRQKKDDKYKKSLTESGTDSSTTSPSTSSVRTMRDMKGESIKSAAASVNSWMEEPPSGKVAEASNNRTAVGKPRKSSKSLLNTTARLGRRLMALDLEGESKGRAKAFQKKKQSRGHRKSSN